MWYCQGGRGLLRLADICDVASHFVYMVQQGTGIVTSGVHVLKRIIKIILDQMGLFGLCQKLKLVLQQIIEIKLDFQKHEFMFDPGGIKY